MFLGVNSRRSFIKHYCFLSYVVPWWETTTNTLKNERPSKPPPLFVGEQNDKMGSTLRVPLNLGAGRVMFLTLLLHPSYGVLLLLLGPASFLGQDHVTVTHLLLVGLYIFVQLNTTLFFFLFTFITNNQRICGDTTHNNPAVGYRSYNNE